MLYAIDTACAQNCCVSLLEWGFSVNDYLFGEAAKKGCFGLLLVLIDLDPRFLRKSFLRDYPSRFSNFRHCSCLSEFQKWLQEQQQQHKNQPFTLL